MNLFSKVIEGINVCLFVTFLIVIESICIYTLVFVCFNILSYTRNRYSKDKKFTENPIKNIWSNLTPHENRDMNDDNSSDEEMEIKVQETNLDEEERADKPP